MLILGIGSMRFCLALRRGNWLPQNLATWGIVGYAALAAGALLELITDRSVAIAFAIPGGLFELTVGFYLLRRGFLRRNDHASGRNTKPICEPSPQPQPPSIQPRASSH